NDTATTEIYTLSLHDALPISGLIAATAEELVFTSGGTEGNALAIGGLLRGARAGRGNVRLHVVSSPIEHPSVLGALAAADADLTLLPVGPDGAIDPAALRA